MNMSKPLLNIKQFSTLFGWNTLQWLILLVVLIIAISELVERQQQRLVKFSSEEITVIEQDINQFNTMAERLANMEKLPPVKKQWDYVIAIAKKYGVSMQYSSGSNHYSGPLEAWSGTITGKTGPVLVVAKELQETVPTYLYNFSIHSQNATFEFSVLGSE